VREPTGDRLLPGVRKEKEQLRQIKREQMQKLD
jgi:hypothetical protein